MVNWPKKFAKLNQINENADGMEAEETAHWLSRNAEFHLF